MDAENLVDPTALENFWRDFTPTERAAVEAHDAIPHKDDLFTIEIRRADLQALVSVVGSRPHSEEWSKRIYQNLLDALAYTTSDKPRTGAGIVSHNNVMIEVPPRHARHLRTILMRQPRSDRLSEEVAMALRLTLETM